MQNTTQTALDYKALDVEIAEKVMGWNHIDENEPYRLHKPQGGCIVNGRPQRFSDGAGIIPHDWSPSTEIEHAFQVVTKLMQDNFMVSVNLSHESGCWCLVYPPTGSFIESEYCDTPALAICRASLLALAATK